MNEDFLIEILSHAVKDPTEMASKLSNHYNSFVALAEADIEDIALTLDGDKSTALYLKLSLALVSRRKCDKFAFKKKHTKEETEDYLKAFFFGVSVETIVIISIDSSDKVIACDKVSEGTVNFSNVLPRRVLEIAIKRGARKIIIAHNHPGGYAIPSDDDLSSTKMLSEILSVSGVSVASSYVVAGAECAEICV